LLGWLADGRAADDILTEFPRSSLESIPAHLAFAADRAG